MLSKSSTVFFGGMLLFFNATLRAESNINSAVNSINLRDAITKTFKYNPELRTFGYALKAQEGRQLQAGLSANPELKFSISDALGTGQYKELGDAQASISIGWVLEGDIRQNYIDVSRASGLLLNIEADVKRLDAAAETARLYLIVLAYQARMSNAKETVQLAIETVSAIKKQVTSGKAPQAELARAKAEVARSELEHEDVEHELSSTIRLLAAQWGETLPVFTQVEGNIFNVPIVPSFKVLKTRFNQSAGYLRLISDKRLKQVQLKLESSKSNPEWRVNFGLRHYEATNDQALIAGITIPFGEGSKNTGRIVEAREDLSQTMAKENEIRVRYETILYVLTQELEHSRHRLDTYRNNIIPQLEKALKQTRRAYNIGRYSYLELRSVQSELLDARSSLVEASIGAHLKIIEIERLTGMSMTQPSKNIENNYE